MVTKAIAKTGSTAVARVEDTLSKEQYIKSLLASNYYKHLKNMADCYTVLSLGESLDIPWATAVSNIVLINGKPSLTASLLCSRLKNYQNGKYRYVVEEQSDKQCVIQIHEKVPYCNETTGKESWKWEKPGPKTVFSMEMAKRAGLTSSDTYKKYPEAMLFSRCISMVARTYCSDAFLTVTPYVPEELAPNAKMVMTADGDLIPDDTGGEREVVADAEIITKTPAPKKSIEDLKKKFTASKLDIAPYLKHYGVSALDDLSVEQVSDMDRLLTIRQGVSP